MSVDFAALMPPSRPNWAFIAPKSLGNSHAEPAPVFAVPAATLFAALMKAMEAEPRTRVVSQDPAQMRATFVQRSAVMRFVDNIEAAIVPIDDQHASLALYSHSRVGYSDLGVNHARVARIIERLKATLPHGAG